MRPNNADSRPAAPVVVWAKLRRFFCSGVNASFNASSQALIAFLSATLPAVASNSGCATACVTSSRAAFVTYSISGWPKNNACRDLLSAPFLPYSATFSASVNAASVAS